MSALSFPAACFVEDIARALWCLSPPEGLAVAARGALGRNVCADIAAELSRAMDTTPAVAPNIAAAYGVAHEAAYGADEG